MGLERLQAGEREGTQAALLCGVMHTFSITIIKTPPKTPRAQHIVLCMQLAEKEGFARRHWGSAAASPGN